jgi:archaeoflavoprotein AfpA
MKVAWGITGSGDKIMEVLDAMKVVKEKYGRGIKIEVFLSKAGEQVSKYYNIKDELKRVFERVWEEKNANSPFLAGRIQLGEFAFFLVAPATSNTVAKLVHGISDTLITNSAIQAIKARVPVHIMPVDYREGIVVTKLPNGRTLELRVRKEDAEYVRRLESMEGIFPFERPEDISGLFRKAYEKHTN